MKQLKLNIVISEDNGKWGLLAYVPGQDGSTMYLSAESRSELLKTLCESLDDDNIRYWYLMGDK